MQDQNKIGIFCLNFVSLGVSELLILNLLSCFSMVLSNWVLVFNHFFEVNVLVNLLSLVGFGKE